MESSSFGRLIGVLVSPGKTFRSIAERPTWAVALLVILLVIGAVWYLAGTRTDFRDVMTQTLEQRGREVPAAQVEQQVEVMEKAGPLINAISRPVVTVLLLLFSALLSWLIFKLLGADFSYRSAFAVTVHASMPYVVNQLLSLPVILSRASLGFDDLKTGSLLQSNLAFLAPADAPAWQLAALASLDFFGLWGLVLSIIGYRAISRLSTQAVAITMIVLWLVFVGIGVGLAAAFS
jgi:hypothetical protein